MTNYSPGRCNIGRKGRVYRAVFGVTFLLLSVALLQFMISYRFPQVHRFILVVPLFMGFIGVLESAFSFCVVCGAKGTYNLE